MDFGKFILAFGKKLSLDRNGSESCIAELHGIKEAVSFASSQKSSAYCVKKPYCVADCEEAVHLLTTKKISKQTEKRDLARDIKSIWSSSWGTEVNLKEKLRDSTRFADCLAKLACYNKNFDTAVYLDVVKIPTLSSIASTEKLQRLLKEDKTNADNFKKKWLNKKIKFLTKQMETVAKKGINGKTLENLSRKVGNCHVQLYRLKGRP